MTLNNIKTLLICNMNWTILTSKDIIAYNNQIEAKSGPTCACQCKSPWYARCRWGTSCTGWWRCRRDLSRCRWAHSCSEQLNSTERKHRSSRSSLTCHQSSQTWVDWLDRFDRAWRPFSGSKKVGTNISMSIVSFFPT